MLDKCAPEIKGFLIKFKHSTEFHILNAQQARLILDLSNVSKPNTVYSTVTLFAPLTIVRAVHVLYL